MSALTTPENNAIDVGFRLRPGAQVAVHGSTVLLSRMGRTVRADSSKLAEAWVQLNKAVTGEENEFATHPAVAALRQLLLREGLGSVRPSNGPAADVASLSSSQEWVDPRQVRWELTGEPSMIADVVDALEAWQGQDDLSRLDVTRQSTSQASVVLRLALTHIPPGSQTSVQVVGLSVVRDGDALAVLDTADEDLLAAWRARVPAPTHEEPQGSEALATLAAGVLVHAACRRLAGAATTHTWHRIEPSGVTLRILPELHVELTPVDEPNLALPVDLENWGELIDKLRADMDEEFGWWTNPHPEQLLQLPQALLHSLVRTETTWHAVGTGTTHDEAWATTALAVAAQAVEMTLPPGRDAIAFAGVGPVHALGDLLRRCALAHTLRFPTQWRQIEAPVDLGSLPTLLTERQRLQVERIELDWATVVRLSITDESEHRETLHIIAVGPDLAAAVTEATRSAIARLQLLSQPELAPGRYRFAQLAAHPQEMLTAFLSSHVGLGQRDAAALIGRVDDGDKAAWKRVISLAETAYSGSIQFLSPGPHWRDTPLIVGALFRSSHDVHPPLRRIS